MLCSSFKSRKSYLDLCLENLLLTSNIQFIRGNDVYQLWKRQQEKLLMLHHLLEVVLGKLVCNPKN